MPKAPIQKRFLYGRQKSHKLSPRQQTLIDTKLSKIRLDLTAPFDAARFNPNDQELWLEIGFGGGEHLAHLAAHHKDIKFIGCEPFINGVAKLLVTIEDENLTNISLYNDDALHLLTWLPAASLTRIYLLYPDPWPKKRHHKRRFINSETLGYLAEKMRRGGQLLIASDIGDYIRTSLITILGSNDFKWTAKSAKDWQTPPADWPGTRYEKKAIKAGRTPTYIKLVRA